MPELQVLYEDNHLLAVNKPAGVATMGALPGQLTMAVLCKQYLKRRYRKPGNVYLGVVSRLDAAASGVLLFARTSKAAARLSAQFRETETTKQYWAVVAGRIEPEAGELTDWLLKDDKQQRMKVVLPNSPGARQAKLRYRRLQLLADSSLVEIDLETGRKHQIRVQLAERGFPILGDQKYGCARKFPGPARGPAIALHARRLIVSHPVKQEPIELVAALPASWKALGITVNMA